LAVFSDLGLKQSVVQSKRGDDPAFLNTIWTIQIVRGFQLFLSTLAVALAVYGANYFALVSPNSAYADSRLPYIIAAVSLNAVISGFTSTKLYEASRSLAIRRVTLVDVVAQIAGLVCMLGWVAIDRSIWALVSGGICSSLVTMALSHLWIPGADNRWEWDRSAFREIIHFGKWILVSSIIGALIANSDRMFLGGMVDATALGIYAIAYNIYLAAEQVLMKMVSGVAYPALSEVARDRPDDLRSAYYRLHIIVALLAYFGSGVLMTSGQYLIRFLYDPRYADAGWMLQILAAGLLAVPFQISMQGFLALGKPKLNSLVSGLRLLTVVIAMPVGFSILGLQGALIGFVSSIVICVPLIAVLGVREKLLDLRRELLAIPAIAIGIGTGRLFAMLMAHLNYG
jgi:O-antigen/teichoic acid export membrane protein